MTARSNVQMPTRYTTERPICVAILAMGGQGGGVLSDWIVALAESQGWHVQSTSIPAALQSFRLCLLRAKSMSCWQPN